jgi:hypothetical protein
MAKAPDLGHYDRPTMGLISPESAMGIDTQDRSTDYTERSMVTSLAEGGRERGVREQFLLGDIIRSITAPRPQ